MDNTKPSKIAAEGKLGRLDVLKIVYKNVVERLKSDLNILSIDASKLFKQIEDVGKKLKEVHRRREEDESVDQHWGLDEVLKQVDPDGGSLSRKLRKAFLDRVWSGRLVDIYMEFDLPSRRSELEAFFERAGRIKNELKLYAENQIKFVPELSESFLEVVQILDGAVDVCTSCIGPLKLRDDTWEIDAEDFYVSGEAINFIVTNATHRALLGTVSNLHLCPYVSRESR